MDTYSRCEFSFPPGKVSASTTAITALENVRYREPDKVPTGLTGLFLECRQDETEGVERSQKILILAQDSLERYQPRHRVGVMCVALSRTSTQTTSAELVEDGMYYRLL